MLGGVQLESSFAQKDLGVLAGTNLNVSQHRALLAKKGNGTMGSIRKSTGSTSREVILPLCLARGKPHLEQRALWSGALHILERAQQRATRTIKSWVHPTCKERLRGLGLISLENKTLKGISMCTNVCWKGVKMMKPDSGGPVTGQEAMGNNQNT